MKNTANLRLLISALCLALPVSGASQADSGRFQILRSTPLLSGGTPVTVTVAPRPGVAPLSNVYTCRVVPAHSDIGRRGLRDNGCAVQFYIHAGQTRLSRFELDPTMSIDVIVYRGRRRVGYLSTVLKYVP